MLFPFPSSYWLLNELIKSGANQSASSVCPEVSTNSLNAHTYSLCSQMYVLMYVRGLAEAGIWSHLASSRIGTMVSFH
jgi:hypothetical protein